MKLGALLLQKILLIDRTHGVEITKAEKEQRQKLGPIGSTATPAVKPTGVLFFRFTQSSLRQQTPVMLNS
ncbi:hypothetical protein XEU83M_16025 [Xanthomonas euvesicatoria]|uniref:Uncharacterized protein n=1 Tax=Xanthomonas axonopodis pv. cajani TaxID=487827 RepID=A0ABX3M7N5_9XANT|nr:hypothetical protein XEU83M_16025 [Xanthomonas euvesicatoria]OOX10453.1 hypothetical protein Xcaj_15940 [Xanthomonas axonopodis pv. cajani]